MGADPKVAVGIPDHKPAAGYLAACGGGGRVFFLQPVAANNRTGRKIEKLFMSNKVGVLKL